MKKLLYNLFRRMDPIMAVIGMGLIVVGVGCWSKPAAMITAGVLVLADMYLAKKGGEK